MSMTREGAIEVLRKLPVDLMDLTNEQKWDLPSLRRSHDGRGRRHGDAEIGGAV